MPKHTQNTLFQLIKSLSKAEKRNFKLHVKRNSMAGDLKTVLLFDLIDKMEDYDETGLSKKKGTLKKAQLPNLKASLYKQILASLRVLRDGRSVEVQLHELMENAQILYSKGLYMQSLTLLDKVIEIAKIYNQNTYWSQAVIFEKKIELLHITRSVEGRAAELATEVNLLTERLNRIGRLSNLALLLYDWYIRVGHARNAKDLEAVAAFASANLPADIQKYDDFYTVLYLNQALCWQHFIIQDLVPYYKYVRRWVQVFEKEPQMKEVEPLYFIKGMHNLLGAHFLLRNHAGFAKDLAIFETFVADLGEKSSQNLHVQTQIYINMARLNACFLSGNFSENLHLVPQIETMMETYEDLIDRHRILIMHYKIACLYFGSGGYSTCIDYLNKIIHRTVDLRTDLQCYARLLHLIAHYELGNFELLEHLVKSVYRFMAKMENLSVVEEEIFKFIRKAFKLESPAKIQYALQELLLRLKKYENDPSERRSFMYLDFTAWLEGKLMAKPVEVVIREREGRV